MISVSAELGSFFSCGMIVGGLIAFVGNILFIYQNKGYQWLWVKWNYAAMSLYWSGLYLVIKFFPQVFKGDPQAFSRTWVRPVLDWLILLLAVTAWMRIRSLYIPDIIRDIIAKTRRKKNGSDDLD